MGVKLSPFGLFGQIDTFLLPFPFPSTPSSSWFPSIFPPVKIPPWWGFDSNENGGDGGDDNDVISLVFMAT